VIPAGRPSIRPALAALLVLLVAFVAACGNAEIERVGEEGQFVEAGDAVYQVQLSRLLNGDQRPDDTLLEGQPPAAPNEQYMGVFMVIENKGDKPYTPPEGMKVIDTEHNEYESIDASQSGFGLSFEDPIEPGGVAPPPDSPAAGGPDAASLVLFKLKQVSATTNLPLEMEIPVPGEEPARIGIDL
jgi:hypothetical protein